MFITALFTIVKTWKQPKRPWTDEMDREDVVCVCVCVRARACVVEYYSAIKKNETMPFAAT